MHPLFSGHTNRINIQEVPLMKVTDRDKSIHTVPQGAWESGVIKEPKSRSEKQGRHLNDITTDGQENGYPVSGKRQDD